MRTYGWHKVMQGETTIEEVISVTSSDIGGAD
jgi:type II secretory ATPase GspE/PulE/Tfp pilus assembly ATPase PilB-like protein